MAGNLTAEIMIHALNRLDELSTEPVTLIVGGGGAMILAHGFPLATSDLDAIPRQMDPSLLDGWVKQIAAEQKLPSDWLNPYFSTFTHTLPQDYGQRLIQVFQGARLQALALGKEEMLIMKCFAHRQKDINHARALIKKGADVEFVETHLEQLRSKGIPGATEALDFLDEMTED
jgi:hypothetical protein